MCTPRTRAWLRDVAYLLPQDQATLIAQECEDKSYTSVDVMLNRCSGHALMESSKLEQLKPGAKQVLDKKLEGLEVHDCAYSVARFLHQCPHSCHVDT